MPVSIVEDFNTKVKPYWSLKLNAVAYLNNRVKYFRNIQLSVQMMSNSMDVIDHTILIGLV